MPGKDNASLPITELLNCYLINNCIFYVSNKSFFFFSLFFNFLYFSLLREIFEKKIRGQIVTNLKILSKKDGRL